MDAPQRLQGAPDQRAVIERARGHLTKILGEAPAVTLEMESHDLDFDALLTCTYRGQQQTYAVLAHPQFTARTRLRVHSPLSSMHDPGTLPLLITERVGEASAKRLKDAGIQYIDTLGNAHIQFGPVLIDVQGRRRHTPRTTATNNSANLMSPRRAQIIMCLIAWPELLERRLQDLADASGTSPSQVHQTLKLLEDAGYAREKALLRSRCDALIDLWAGAYATQLGPTLDREAFTSQQPGAWPTIPEGILAHRSGETAVPHLLTPTTATVYLHAVTPDLIQANRWVRTDRPNVLLRKRFWRSPDESPRATGTFDAPWPIIYADLLSSTDPRHRQAAQAWRRDHAH